MSNTAKTKTALNLLLVLIAALAIAWLPGCDQPTAIDPTHDSALVGTWQVVDGPTSTWTLTFAADGSCGYLDGCSVSPCAWTSTAETVTMTFENFGTLTSGWSVCGDVLTLDTWFAGEWSRVK